MTISKEKYNLYFGIFALFHIILWTILPYILRNNLPLDTIEAIAWGKEMQFGYYKHPPLSAWLANITFVIFENYDYAFYLLSQICIAVALLFIWRIANLFLLPQQAFMATILTEGIYYYNITSTEFNPNVLLLPLWASTIFYFYKACATNKIPYWLIFGTLSGFALLAKYHSAFLLLSIVLIMFYQPKFRLHLKTINPYLTIITFILIISPHLLWMLEHNFQTVYYGLESSDSSNYRYYNHFSYASGFVAAQLLSVLGAILIFFIAFRTKLAKINFNMFRDEKLAFLMFVGFGPCVLTALYSVITAARLKDMWGTPFWGLFTISLFYFYQPLLNIKTTKKFYKGSTIIIVLFVTIYIASFMTFSKRAYFDGKQAAKQIDKEWHSRYNESLKFVIGNTWLTSNIAFYSDDRPSVFTDMMIDKSPWISISDIKNYGGIIVWGTKEDGNQLPKKFTQQCNNNENCFLSNIEIQQPIIIHWKGVFFDYHEPYQMSWAIINKPNSKQNF